MSPQALVDRIATVLPGFEQYWTAEPNLHRAEDGTFTQWGVFSTLTKFYKDHIDSLTPDRIAALADFINHCMASGDQDLDNAAATCFVENIAGDDCAQPIAPHFSKRVLAYFEQWGGVPVEDVALRKFLRRQREVP